MNKINKAHKIFDSLTCYHADDSSKTPVSKRIQFRIQDRRDT